jgi:hypothetical protein
MGAAVFGLIAFGLAAVQLLPGVEYLRLTTRSDFGFEAKGNGFPIQDVFQFFVPSVVSVFSPLFFGVAGLLLAIVALWRRSAETRFWGAAALVALLWSFGANSLLYPLLYNTLPGAYFFRGQERAAFVVANAGAILAGLGVIRLMAWRALPRAAPSYRLRRLLWGVAIALMFASVIVLVAWFGHRELYGSYLPYFALSALVSLVCALLLPQLTRARAPAARLLALLVVFELFTISMDSDAVYDPVPPTKQLSLTPPPLIQQALDDPMTPFRVDGFRGLGDNYGSLYAVADIRGISPLWLGSAYALIEGDLPDPITWELFAVRYVFTDWNELPVPSQTVGRGTDRYGEINLHMLANPRPFVLPMASYEVVADDAQARMRLSDPTFNLRTTILVNSEPGITPDGAESVQVARVQQAPEQTMLTVNSPNDTILSISMVDYPGWYATVNDQPTDILRAYGGLMAVVVPAGESTIRLTYDPLSYRIGALISLVTWAGIAILGIVMLINRWRR